MMDGVKYTVKLQNAPGASEPPHVGSPLWAHGTTERWAAERQPRWQWPLSPPGRLPATAARSARRLRFRAGAAARFRPWGSLPERPSPRPALRAIHLGLVSSATPAGPGRWFRASGSASPADLRARPKRYRLCRTH